MVHESGFEPLSPGFQAGVLALSATRAFVTVTGFEPATSSSPNSRSTRLSFTVLVFGSVLDSLSPSILAQRLTSRLPAHNFSIVIVRLRSSLLASIRLPQLP